MLSSCPAPPFLPLPCPLLKAAEPLRATKEHHWHALVPLDAPRAAAVLAAAKDRALGVCLGRRLAAPPVRPGRNAGACESGRGMTMRLCLCFCLPWCVAVEGLVERGCRGKWGSAIEAHTCGNGHAAGVH